MVDAVDASMNTLESSPEYNSKSPINVLAGQIETQLRAYLPADVRVTTVKGAVNEAAANKICDEIAALANDRARKWMASRSD